MVNSDILHCTLIPDNVQSRHSLIYTGLARLHKLGLIRLKQKFLTSPDPSSNHLIYVVINNNIRLCYDTGDDYKIFDKHMSNVDYYFKRSYLPELHGNYDPKVLPLGLNYEVYNNSFDFFDLKRKLIFRKGFKSIIKSCLSSYYTDLNIMGYQLVFKPTISNMYSSPIKQFPRILFMARTWDPSEKESGDKKQERACINEMRALCIQLLRKEFGKHFTGGFKHTNYAVKNYKDALLHNGSLYSKTNYIRLLKEHPICIATTGLHGSIGWKLAEYVAFSKAIVSEKLNYVVPGNFSKNANYLEFDTAEECVERAVKLFTDEDLRFKIMQNNNKYYHNYLRPDVLVFNTLKIATSIKD